MYYLLPVTYPPRAMWHIGPPPKLSTSVKEYINDEKILRGGKCSILLIMKLFRILLSQINVFLSVV